MIRRVEDDLRRRARALLDAVRPGVAFDFWSTSRPSCRCR